MTTYGYLFDSEDTDPLWDELYKQVVIALAPFHIAESVRRMIPEYVSAIVKNGPPGFMLRYLVEGKHMDIFCAGCTGAPCCNKNDPIAITYEDIKRIAKREGISSKECIKRYFDHKGELPGITGVSHKMRHTKPCAWNDPATFRCTIYKDRPSVCRNYPLERKKDSGSGEAADSSAPLTPEGEVGLGIAEYCNMAFNMMKLAIIELVRHEDLRVTNPALMERGEAAFCKVIPSMQSIKDLNQAQRFERHKLAVEAMNEVIGMSLDKLETV